MKTIKPHKVHSICLSALSTCIITLFASSSAYAGNYGQEITNPSQIKTPITEDQTGTYAGIYIHDLTGSSSSNLEIGQDGTPVHISSTGNSTFVIDKWYDPKQKELAPSGLIISRSDLGDITIHSGSSVSGKNGVSLVRPNKWLNDKNTSTINSLTNNGTISSKGGFTGFQNANSLFTGNAGLLIGGGWNEYNGAPSMVVKSVQNTGDITSETGSGIWVGMGGKIEALNNTGTISGKYAGIYLQYVNITNGWYYKSEISSINSSGVISGGSFGIYLNNGIQNRNAVIGNITLTNTGSITGGQGGILATKFAEVGAIKLQDTASITATNNTNSYGIQALADAKIASITLSNNAKITGGAAGIGLGWATISGGISLSGDTSANASGALISGGVHGINSDGVIFNGITLTGQSSIMGQQSQGINNTGRIQKADNSGYAISLAGSSSISGGQIGIYNAGDIVGDITVDATSKITGADYGIYNDSKGKITGKIDVSGTLTGVYNKGSITGPIIVSGNTASKFNFYNSNTVGGELNLKVQGAVTGQNDGNIAGALTVQTADNITFNNQSTINGKVDLAGKQVQFANSGTFLESLTITASGTGTNNAFSNTQQLDTSLTLNISGNLTFTNSGHITKALSLTRAGSLVFTNSATIDNDFIISGSGAVQFANQAGGNLKTITIQGADGASLQNAGSISGLLTVSGTGTTGSYKDFSLSNTGSLQQGLSGQNFKNITLQNQGNGASLLGNVTLNGQGSLSLLNEGTRSGSTTLSGAGAFTFANSHHWQGDVTITGATTMALSNTSSVTGQTLISGSGQFTWQNTQLWQGGLEVSGAHGVTIHNQGDYSSGNGKAFKVLGTNEGDLQFSNTQVWNSNLDVSGVNAMTLINEGTVTAPNSTINGSGHFSLTNTKSWTGNLTVTGAQDVTIENPGTFSGNLNISKGSGTAGKVLFTNVGTFKGNASIDFAGQDSLITNAGLFDGELTLNGSGTVTVISKNLWGGAITQLGPNSKLQIKEWVVAVTGTDGQYNVVNTVNVTQSDTPLSRSTRSAQNENITLDKVVISYADPTKANVSYSIDLNKVFSVNGGTTDANTIKPTDASLAPDVQAMGFQGKYYYDEGLYRTTFDTGVTAGAIVSKTMASQLFRRDFFVEAAINESAVGSMYHRRLDGIKGTVFVKPYFSYDTFSEDQVRASGHTQGVMAGMTGFLGRHIVTGIVGYERSQIGTNYLTSDLDLDMQSWYASLMTSHIMFSNRFFDAFGKVTAKASYTQSDITRTLSTLNSEADTKAYSYGANLQMGANIRGIPGGNIIPMIGVGYAMGLTQDYQLDNTGTINDKYIPDNIKLPFADASVTWFQSWNSIVKTFVSAGYRYNLKPTQKTAVQFGANTIHGEFELPKHYQYINSSIVLHMTKDSELAIGYTGVMDETGKSHNLTTKYEIHF